MTPIAYTTAVEDVNIISDPDYDDTDALPRLTGCMQGYINDTLSTAYLTHPAIQQDFLPSQLIVDGLNVTHCRYRDYRNTDDYTLTSQFWIIIAVRFAFIILFEHVVVMCKFIAAWFVPDCPMRVKNKRLQDKLGRLKEELRYMKHYCRSTDV